MRRLNKLSIFFFSLLILILTSEISFSQNVNAIEKYPLDEWTLYQEISGVEIYFQKTECHDIKYDKHAEYVLIKIINTTKKDLKVQWKREIWYNYECFNCESESEEYISKVLVKAGESIEGNCSKESNRNLNICSKLLRYNTKKLTDFKMTGLKAHTMEK